MSFLSSKLGLSWVVGMAALVTFGAACGKEEATSQSTAATETDPKEADGGTSSSPPGTFGTNDAGPSGASPTNCQALNIGILGIPGENESSNFQVWLADAGTSTTRVLEGTSDRITSAVLAPFDVVVVDHCRVDARRKGWIRRRARAGARVRLG